MVEGSGVTVKASTPIESSRNWTDQDHFGGGFNLISGDKKEGVEEKVRKDIKVQSRLVS